MSSMQSMTADELRRAFLGFFETRGHTVVPSSSLIPHDPSMLLTTAGMVQFKPYMLGDETPVYSRAASVQKCFRTTDIDIIGTTTRHLTFFEMLGNFSLGDYFKHEAIPFAWELVTTGLGLDPDRLWITIFEDDDESGGIWRDEVGIAGDRIQRCGADDNFWAMGPTGPCGPCSEIYYDRGPDLGAAGGPVGGGPERYVEIWNLVFMQYNRTADGELRPLPRRNIDTGAGLERILAVLQDTHSVFETDVLRRILAVAEDRTGTRYGATEAGDVSLRILAEHGRAMTFLIADGVVPSNEDRGYVLRRIIRRAVRHAFLLGNEEVVTPALVEATVETMGDAYPDVRKQAGAIGALASREEERFRSTLRRGIENLDELLARGNISGEDAFHLHDTLGFPIDVTREIAAERGREVDLVGFESSMRAQRERAQQAQKASGVSDVGTGAVEAYRAILGDAGPTEFTGYQESVTTGARVVGIVLDGRLVESVPTGSRAEIVMDRTPFYAEAGGQVGDVGVLIAGSEGEATVSDTVYGLPGMLILHRCEVVSGSIAVGAVIEARIDEHRRAQVRRNHTATHLLHWGLREVLGDQVKQAGSLVAPDRLRFDFSHFEAVGSSALRHVEELANAEVLRNAPVHAYETTREHADEVGAVAFFGDKYGDVVRVVEAGEHSVELCGGTHVHALGMIGPIKILGESSIGANLRRIEAVTGDAAITYMRDQERSLRRAAGLLNVKPDEVVGRVERVLEQVRTLEFEVARLRESEAARSAGMLAASAIGGVVAERRDGADVDELRRLAVATREALGTGIVVLVGASPNRDKAGLVVAVSRDLQDRGVSAAQLASDAARALGGGTAKNPDLVTGGGPSIESLDEALELARRAAADTLANLG